MRADTLKIIMAIFVFTGCTSSKKIPGADTTTLENLRTHIQYLADDKLEGRRTGTKGEELAVEYISNQFRSIGLQPRGTEYYTQSFTVNDGKKSIRVHR